MSNDGTWLAIGAVATLAAAARRTGSRNIAPQITIQRARKIRERFAGDQPGYLQIARLARAELAGDRPVVGRTIFPTKSMWKHWTDPDPDQGFARFIDAFWSIWKGGGAEQAQQRRALAQAKAREKWWRSAKTQVLTTLHARARRPFREWLKEEGLEQEASQGKVERLELFEQWLGDGPMLSVREDGLISVDHDLGDTRIRRLIGQLPIVMFHGTSTALLPGIRRQGLRPARGQQQKSDPTFSTASGVYLDLRPDVDVYSSGAAARHGGRPVVLTVRRRLSQIQPDPDDEHLQWSTSAMQYITAAVPPSDVVEWS